MFNKTDPSIFEGEWNFEKTERAIMGLTKILNRYAHKLTLEDLRNDPRCARIPDLSPDVVQQVIDDVEAKLWRGVTPLLLREQPSADSRYAWVTFPQTDERG